MTIVQTAIKKGRRALAGAGLIAPERLQPVMSMRHALKTVFAKSMAGPDVRNLADHSHRRNGRGPD